MIQIVKFLFLLIFPVTVYCQGGISGTYILNTPFGNGGSEFNFTENNRFTFTMYEAPNQKFISSGYYLISNDTLVLVHEMLVDKDSSYYEIDSATKFIMPSFGNKQAVSEKALNAEFTVYGNDNTLLPSASIVALKDEQIIFIDTLNKEGKVDIYTSGKFIDGFKIIYIGYKNLSIDTKNLWGKNIKINVFLSHVQTRVNSQVKIVKYLVKRNESGTLISFGKVDSNYHYSKE